VDLAIQLFYQSSRLDKSMLCKDTETYLLEASSKKEQWLTDFKHKLSDEVDEENFKRVINRDLFSTSNLRMAITKRMYSRSGRKVISTSAITVVLEFLQRDKIIKMQQCCKKLYRTYVPKVINTCSVWARPSVEEADRYQIVWDGYLG